MNPLYDLTGSDPNFRTENREFVVFTDSQVIDLGTAVYASGGDNSAQYKIKIERLENNSWIEMFFGTEYSIDGYLDVIATSTAKLQSGSETPFTKVLFNKFRITRAFTTEYKIRCTYQYFEQNMLNIASEHPTGPVSSPELLKTYAVTLDYLLNTVNNSLGTVLLPTVLALPEDWTGVASGNYIDKGDTQVINVSNYRQIIRPIAGSFYGYDVKIFNKTTGDEIPQHVYDEFGNIIQTNYVITACNLKKTAGCTHPSGVYDYIFMTIPMNGTIQMSYHAFGGEATMADVLSLRDSITSIINTLNSDSVITTSNIGYTDVVREQNYRLGVLEESLRHYPISTFVIDPTTSVYPIDGKFHWFNVAMISKDAWFNSIVPKQTYGTMRIALADRGIIYDVTIRTDLHRNELQLQAKTIACIDSNSFVDQYQVNGDISTALATTIDLKMRLVWINRSSVEGAPRDYPDGCVLQFGFVPTANEVIKISDRTGHDSDWALYQGVDDPIYYTDNNITLPAGTLWVDGNEQHKSAEAVICPIDGYLAWSGNYACSMLMDSASLLLNCLRNTSIAKYVTKVRFKFYDRVTGKYIADDAVRVYDGSDDFTGASIFYVDDLCSISFETNVVHAEYDSSGELISPADFGFKVACKLGTQSLADDRFELRQIIFYF